MENTLNTQEKFRNWLKTNSQEVCYIKVDEDINYAFLKNRIREGIDIIYYFDIGESETITVYEEPKCQGIYKVDEDKIYAAGSAVHEILGEEEMNPTVLYNVRHDFVESVREGIEAKVEEYEKTLVISDDEREKQQHYVKDRAKKLYLKGVTANFGYECQYEDDYFHKKILEYITEPQPLIDRTVEEFFTRNIEDIRYEVIGNRLTEELVKKYKNGDEPHLSVLKNIITAIPQDCKTVNVTTVIDGVEVTFRYDASPLRRDCGCSYSTWDIIASDRIHYEASYGSHKSFIPEDITRITYCRKVLYEKG